MLDRPTALSFVAGMLGVPDVSRRLVEDRAGFLDDVIVRFLGMVPFHNMFVMELGVQGIPTVKENVHSMLTLQGGLCWTQNSAMCILLHTLGYDAFPALSTVVQSGPADLPNHVVTIVRGLATPSSLHLVEVGVGVTTLRAVRFDNFQHESVEYMDSYQTYKLVKRDGRILRMYKFDPVVPKKYYYSEGKWGQLYDFKPEPVAWSVIREALDQSVYSNPEMFFKRSVKAWVYRRGKMEMVENDVLVVKSDEGVTETSVLEGEEQIVRAVKEIVTRVDEGVIRRAVTRWVGMRDGKL